MEYIESPLFSKLIGSYLEDEEYAAFQWELALHPERGDLIPGSGGLRKIRWAAKGKGKRGGTRIIYYYKNKEGKIWLLTIYAKNEADTIPISILKKIKEELEL
jgi:mRNA-degrading endonuclease RelE of RelBE toxin-antitoxin system